MASLETFSDGLHPVAVVPRPLCLTVECTTGNSRTVAALFCEILNVNYGLHLHLLPELVVVILTFDGLSVRVRNFSQFLKLPQVHQIFCLGEISCPLQLHVPIMFL